MKTKRKAIRLPSSQPEEALHTANLVSPLKGKHSTSSLLKTKTIEPHSSTKRTNAGDVIVSVRRSQRIRTAVSHHPMLGNADPEIQIIDTSGTEQDERGNPAQCFPDQNLNQSQIEDIEPEQQNQYPAGIEKGSEDNDSSADNSIELEPDEPKTDKSKGSKIKSVRQYRTMYRESQKKIRKLTHANNELSKKLAVAEGKLEVYEKGCGFLASIINNTKDLFMASAVPNATNQDLAGSAPCAKPKRKTSRASKRKKPVARLL